MKWTGCSGSGFEEGPVERSRESCQAVGGWIGSAPGGTGWRRRWCATITTRGWLAAALLKGGSFARARDHAEILVKRRPGEGVGWRVRGAVRLLEGSPRASLADLSRAVSSDPSDLESVLWRGEARLALKDWAGAYRDYERAVSAWGASLVPYVGLSLALLGQGREPGGGIDEIVDCLWPDATPAPRDGRRAAALWKVLRGLKGDRSRFPGAGNLGQAARETRRERQLAERVGEMEKALRDFEAFADSLPKGGLR